LAGPLAVVCFIGKYFGIDPGSLLLGLLVSAGIVGTPSRFSSKIRIHARSKELDRGLTPNSQTQPGAGKFVFDKLFKPANDILTFSYHQGRSGQFLNKMKNPLLETLLE
jgi:hypothetical protein